MLDKLSKFFSVSEECEQDIEKLIRLATASLLVEVVRADFERDISEEKTMATQLEKILNIPFLMRLRSYRVPKIKSKNQPLYMSSQT